MSTFQWPELLNALIAGADLGRAGAHAAMTEIMAGRATEAQIAALMIGLRAKG